jgi:23S rRNA (adenine2503-C2)-methyltransferase
MVSAVEIKRNLYDLSISALSDWVVERDLKPYAATQIIKWLYDKKVTSFEGMTNVSKRARALLEEEFVLKIPTIVDRHQSDDGTIKFGCRLEDDEIIECVLIPQQNRITLCVSCQVGCAMGCTFCKTAEMKIKRNLSQGEILGQVFAAICFCESDELLARRVCETAQHDKITNIVFMGMGEPLHNFESVIEAIRILLDDRAFNFSWKRITVSTVGLAPEIVRFADAVPAKLAVSLNATCDALRTNIMPINRRHDLDELMEACREYARRRDQFVTFEYVMLRDINDSLKQAADLVRLISHTPCKINLIPFNGYPGSPYQCSEDETIEAFYRYLADRGFQVNIRQSKGLDVLAACGQLATENKYGLGRDTRQK